MVFPNPLPDQYSHSELCFESEAFPSHQKKIAVLHIYSHATYNVTEIEKQAAGIHSGSVGQGHCEGQRFQTQQLERTLAEVVFTMIIFSAYESLALPG